MLVSRSSYPGEEGILRRVFPARTDYVFGRLAADFLNPLWLPRADLFHYPKGFLPGLRPGRGVIVGTVHDVILQHYADRYPESRSRAAFAYWIGAVKRSVPRFDCIMTISEVSARGIAGFCARYGIRTPPIRVAHPGCPWDDEPWQRHAKRDVVIHIGSLEPHKQTAALVRLWNSLNPPGLKLLVVGAVATETARAIAASPSIEARSNLPGKELRAAVGEARALILPSEIEGFGFPALEAYAVGTPVVFVRETSVEEVIGCDVPGAFSLDAPDSFRAALEGVLHLTEEETRAKRAQLLTQFTWENCARKTLAAYREFAA